MHLSKKFDNTKNFVSKKTQATVSLKIEPKLLFNEKNFTSHWCGIFCVTIFFKKVIIVKLFITSSI